MLYNFYSPKGGVGTTTMACAMAVTLAKNGPVGITSVGTQDFRYIIDEVNGVEFRGGLEDEVVDVGTRDHGMAAGVNVMVLRSSYLSLKRALYSLNDATSRPDVVVVVEAEQDALKKDDIKCVLGLPCLQVPLRPTTARTIDGGLFGSRIPASISDVMDRIIAGSW